MRARVFVTLKPSVFDPQGRTIAEALHSLGYGGVEDVRQGKYFELDLATTESAEAKALASEVADRLLATRIMTSFGILAFVVAAAGIYGVMAFLVANRAREIGIRMALGADSRRIRRLVLGSSMGLVLLGAAIGIGGAFVASRWIQSQLFGVTVTDPIAIVVATVGVAVTALLATWHPARQATRVDPKVLLRN